MALRHFFIKAMITKKDILLAQEKWADAIVRVGADYKIGQNEFTSAIKHIMPLYDFENNVMFKPTLAINKPFRFIPEEILSYFIGGCVDEDNGFALRPWKKIVFENNQIIIDGNTAYANGTYNFIEYNNKTTKAFYTFGYKKIMDELKIFIQHSSLPPTK